ncbi:Carboxyl-terminal-processing protease [Hordeum vulgare]|nr:Carboxyl-terminal-processing protease [Hordeum vulgare]
MDKLGGEIVLGDGVVDVGEPVGDFLYARSIFRDRQAPLLEVAILPVEDHEAFSSVGEEVIMDLLSAGKGSGGTNDMIGDGIARLP